MIRGYIGEVAILAGLLDRATLDEGKTTVSVRCIFPERHVNGDAHPSAWLHMVYNTYRCTCGAQLNARELALALGVRWPIKLPRTHSATQVWEHLALRDAASQVYLSGRYLDGILSRPESNHIVRFNTGATDDMWTDNLAWGNYRIACPIRRIAKPTDIMSVQFRLAGPLGGRKMKTINLRDCPIRGGAFMSPELFDVSAWSDNIVVVEGLADFLAACIRGWAAVGMTGAEFAGSVADALAPRVNGLNVFVTAQRDETGQRASQIVVDTLAARSSANLHSTDFRDGVKDLADDLQAELQGVAR